jgi:hypothetical protein
MSLPVAVTGTRPSVAGVRDASRDPRHWNEGSDNPEDRDGDPLPGDQREPMATVPRELRFRAAAW